MRDVQLPDGTWVTTPIAVAIGEPGPACAAGCRWEDYGPPGLEAPRVQMQCCRGCGWIRGRYLDDPTKEPK